LEEAVDTRRFDSSALHAAVTTFAGRSRTAGVPPEQLVIQLKAIVRDDTLPISDWWRSVLTDRVVRWGVEGYYHLEADKPADDASAEGE
jgi:hypothetical protein